MINSKGVDENFSNFLLDQLKSLHERVVQQHQQALASNGSTSSEPKVGNFAIQQLPTVKVNRMWSTQSTSTEASSDVFTPLSSLDVPSRLNSAPNSRMGSFVGDLVSNPKVGDDQPVRRSRRANTATAVLTSLVARTFGGKQTDLAVHREQPGEEDEKINGTGSIDKKMKFDPVVLNGLGISPSQSPSFTPLGFSEGGAQPDPITPRPGAMTRIESDAASSSGGAAFVLDGNGKFSDVAAAQYRKMKSGRSMVRTGTRKGTIGKTFQLRLHQEWAEDAEAEKENETRLKLFRSAQEIPRIQINKQGGFREQVYTTKPDAIIDVESEKATTKKAMKRLSLHSVEEIQNLRTVVFSDGSVRLLTRLCLLFITEPTTRTRIVWDFCGLLLLGYDIVIIPLQVFDLGATPFLISMQWVVLLYWSADIVASFFVGFHVEGIVEIRPQRIARRYFKSWFAIDVALVLVDVMIMLTGTEDGKDPSGVARLGKSFRALRILRAVRLVRLAKLPKMLEKIQEQVQSEYLIVMISIAKLTTFLLASNHFIACAWYAIGVDNSASWIEAYEIEHETGLYRYATSLHWSLTQFTPASMEVFPQNLTERVFCVIVLVFAMVTFSSFVSSITNAMTSLRNMNVDATKQQSLLQKYLRLNKINLSLSVRIRRYIEFVMTERQCQLREDDVPLLMHLMEPLRIELHYEVFAHALKVHPFFVTMDAISQRVMERICHKAVGEKYTLPGDRIFTCSDSSENMYISINEGLRYQLHEGPTPQDHHLTGAVHCIHKDQCICEIVIWSTWVHKGDCWGESYCHTVMVNSNDFRDAVKGASYPRAIMSHYAYLYVDHAKQFLNVMTDLHQFDFNMERAICVALFDDIESDSDSEEIKSSEEDSPAVSTSWAARLGSIPNRLAKDALQILPGGLKAS